MEREAVDPQLAGLNAPQRAAVLHDGGPLVVFAGAGSGKTRVITHRVAHLVRARGVAPWNVLAVTFTNKAAQEMRERLGELIGGASRDLWVGTFHATCARLLRRYADACSVRSDFTIYDAQDQQAMVKRVLRDLGIDPKSHDPKQLANRIARAKQEVKGPDQLDGQLPHEVVLQQVYRTYDQRMRASGALDFADLLYRLVCAVESDEGLRRELAGRFRHLLVDEFQDTNHVQYRLVRALAAEHRQVTVVGDDDQSIYRWRGADRRNILSFKEEFPDAEVVKLEQNYRSTARILRAANAVIQKAVAREPKTLWTENEEGAAVHAFTCADERREAELIVEAVRQLRLAGRSLNEVALFYRIHAQSRVFEEELRRTNVPYRIIGGMRFYERAEVKDLLAYLRVLSNPDDDVSLLRIINTPARGIGKKSVERLLERAATEGTGVWAALEKAAAGKGVAAKRLSSFILLMRELADEIAAGQPLAAVGYTAYERSGYKKMLTDQDTPEADARMQNIEELLGAIQLAEESDDELTLESFLEQVTLDTAVEEDAGTERLTLMTVHAAKGLEFPVVFVGGLEEDTFPFRRSRERLLDAEDVEEERRLGYVAMTRAQERLILSWAVSRRLFRDIERKQPSRFLREVPRDDLEEVVDPVIRGSAMRSRSSTSSRYARPARSSRPAAPRAVSTGDSWVDTEDTEATHVRVGMKVEHRKFGRGTVVQIKPSSPIRVDVRFPERGIKTIRIDFLRPA